MQDSSVQSLIRQQDFLQWVEASLSAEKNILARSNQGTILHFDGDDHEVLVKCPMGRGLALIARRRTLMREYRAYQRMQGLSGIPRCFGLVGDHFLAIEYVKGVPYREANWTDRDAWFEEFLSVLRSIHARGVSHGDLKSKSNILVTNDEKVCVLDFGTAFLLKPGFHPVNNALFSLGRKMDLNAWVKHKYHGNYDAASDEDRAILDYSWIERMVRRVRGGQKVR